MDHPGANASGLQRAELVDALVDGRTPPPAPTDLVEWAADTLAGAGPALGVDRGSLPAVQESALAWAGLPLARSGGARWGHDLDVGTGTVPVIDHDRLLVPAPSALLACSAVELKPLRRWTATRFGCRLKAAPGVRLWLWRDRALVVSLRALPLAGFVYGPEAGHRAPLALEPGAAQVVRW
ncbi:MAG: hypothetical protein H0W72_01115 [Planctomycetes bacterium]|nr:hypothetical protein [Planctomycetota bacterium]